PVVELPCRGQHPGPGGRPDPFRIVESQGDGGGGHLRLPGHILNGRPGDHPLAPPVSRGRPAVSHLVGHSGTPIETFRSDLSLLRGPASFLSGPFPSPSPSEASGFFRRGFTLTCPLPWLARRQDGTGVVRARPTPPARPRPRPPPPRVRRPGPGRAGPPPKPAGPGAGAPAGWLPCGRSESPGSSGPLDRPPPPPPGPAGRGARRRHPGLRAAAGR